MRNLQLLIYMVLSSVCYGNYITVTAYYPSGIPYDVFGFGKVTDRLHIGNRWMSLGMNTYDNTARFHYPLIPSFDTPDPCLDKYPDLSPYSHCAGNPLRYVDRNGEWLVGIDGNPVTFNENGWAENIDENIRCLINIMKLTSVGNEVLQDILKAEYPISINLVDMKDFDPTKNSPAGLSDPVVIEENGKQQVKSVKISIYKNVIEKLGSSQPMYKDSGLSVNDIIGTTAVHEGVHATRKEAMYKITGKEKESDAIALGVEQEAVNELKSKKQKQKDK